MALSHPGYDPCLVLCEAPFRFHLSGSEGGRLSPREELAALSSVPVIALAQILSFWPVGVREKGTLRGAPHLI